MLNVIKSIFGEVAGWMSAKSLMLQVSRNLDRMKCLFKRDISTHFDVWIKKSLPNFSSNMKQI